MKILQEQHLKDFTYCPNYYKFNRNNQIARPVSIAERVIKSCIRDASVLSKRTDWKTIRSRVLTEVSSVTDTQHLYNQTIVLLESLRNWYLNNYRDTERNEYLHNVVLTEEINETKLETIIDGLIIKGKQVTLIEFTDLENTDEILRDIRLKLKLYLLGKRDIKITKILAIRCTDTSVKVNQLYIHDVDNINYKTNQVINLIVFSIDRGIYYPSVNPGCSTCPYKSICS